MVIQRRPLPLDFVDAVLLGREFRANRRKLLIGRLQPPPHIVKLALRLLKFLASLRKRGVRLGRRGLSLHRPVLEVRDSSRQLDLRCRQLVAVNPQFGAILRHAVVRRGQVLQFPFGLQMGDFRAFDLGESLVDGRQGIVKLRPDRLDVLERKFD